MRAIRETSLLHFRDDVRVTISEIGKGARLECRSRSRLGTYDFGQNGRNLRELLREVERELG